MQIRDLKSLARAIVPMNELMSTHVSKLSKINKATVNISTTTFHSIISNQNILGAKNKMQLEDSSNANRSHITKLQKQRNFEVGQSALL